MPRDQLVLATAGRLPGRQEADEHPVRPGTLALNALTAAPPVQEPPSWRVPARPL